MAQDINIAEILADKPKGTKLYDIARDIDVYFDNILNDDEIHCTLERDGCEFLAYSHTGSLIQFEKGMVILVPSKEMRDWSKFSWKKGDVLRCNDGIINVIFVKFIDDSYTAFEGIHYFEDGGYDADTYWQKQTSLKTINYSLEKKDSAKHYINIIENKFGGKLNMETLELESKPKYDFKPLDYLLSNDNEDREWILCQFSHIDKKGNIVFVGGSFADRNKVILYEDNEHLLGTTKSLEDLK